MEGVADGGEVAAEEKGRDDLEVEVLRHLVLPTARIVLTDVLLEELSEVTQILLALDGPVEPGAHLQGERRSRGEEKLDVVPPHGVGMGEREVEADEAHRMAVRPFEGAAGSEVGTRGDDVDGLPAGADEVVGPLGVLLPARTMWELRGELGQGNGDSEVEILRVPMAHVDVGGERLGADEEQVGVGPDRANVAQGGELLVGQNDHARYLSRSRRALSPARGSGSLISSA